MKKLSPLQKHQNNCLAYNVEQINHWKDMKKKTEEELRKINRRIEAFEGFVENIKFIDPGYNSRGCI